jgi:hypothetical protein
MPRLEVLGIPDAAKPCEIAWHVLPDAAPQLRGLAMHPSQFNIAIREQLGRLPQLKRLSFFAREQDPQKGLAWALFDKHVVFYLKSYHREIGEFVQARPETIFDPSPGEFLVNLRPPQLTLSQHGLSGTKPHWASTYWIKSSLLKSPPQPQPFAIFTATYAQAAANTPSVMISVPRVAADPFAPAPSATPAAARIAPACDPFAPDPFAPAPPPAPDPFAPTPLPAANAPRG